MIPVNRPLIEESDRKSVIRALDETQISGQSDPVKVLEKKFRNTLSTRYAIAVNSGTNAIDLAIEALGVQPGDECIVPSFTIISSVLQIIRRGAKVILVDSDPETWCMNLEQGLNLMTPKTKLIMPVHIYGLPVDMEPIIENAKVNNTLVIEDSAEALGLKYKNKFCGTIGDIGTFSLYANKIVTAGEGGVVITDNEEFAQKINSLRDLAHTDERFVHQELGWNARLGGLAASLASSQMDRLDELILLKKSIGNQYLQSLENHPWLTFQKSKTSYAENVYWVFGIVLNDESPLDAKQLQSKLKIEGIETRRFFCPMHLQPIAEKNQLISKFEMKVSNRLWDRGLYLPSGLGNRSEEIEKVVETLWKLVQ